VGFDITSGESTYNIKRGEYNPMVSDGKRLYLTGYASITGLAPKSKQPKGTKSKKNGKSKKKKTSRQKPGRPAGNDKRRGDKRSKHRGDGG
jgi:hypothetical protein